MSAHLSDEQIAAALVESSAGGHLAECAECAQEAARLRDAIAGYAQEAGDAVAARDERIWTAERQDVVRRVRVRRLRTALASAGLAAAAAVTSWLAVPRPLPVAAPASADLDHELLVSVERSLNRGLPAALEPAQFLVADVRAAARTTPQ
jgi:hypothetical protein